MNYLDDNGKITRSFCIGEPMFCYLLQKPVEFGSISPLKVFLYIPGGCLGFLPSTVCYVFVGLNVFASPTNNPMEKSPTVGCTNNNPTKEKEHQRLNFFEFHNSCLVPYKHQQENTKLALLFSWKPPIPFSPFNVSKLPNGFFCQNRPLPPPHPFSIFNQGATPVTTSKKGTDASNWDTNNGGPKTINHCFSLSRDLFHQQFPGDSFSNGRLDFPGAKEGGYISLVDSNNLSKLYYILCIYIYNYIYIIYSDNFPSCKKGPVEV